MSTFFNNFDMGFATLMLLSGFLLLLIAVGVVLHVMKTDPIMSVLAIMAVGVAVIIGQGYITNLDRADTQRAQEAQRVWVESHGVSATEDTIAELKFPETPPTSDQEFGIAQVVENKAIISVHLAWENNEFVLYGTDGQPLEAIK